MSGLTDSVFLTMFIGLFGITAPIAAIPLFVSATNGQTGRDRRKTALIATATYMIAAFVALFAGNAALIFFGVSSSGLRLAGMAVVAVIGWKMINAPTVVSLTGDNLPDQHFHSASNTRIDIQRNIAAPSPRSVGITPLGFPIYAGPGVLSVVIAWGSGPEPVYIGAVVAIIANAFVIIGLNFLATTIVRVVSPEALIVTEKLFGLVVVALAVDGMTGALLRIFPGWQ
ncbi:MarC family protein [Novosphingobium sp. G106]|uniref:MarC family protein n=1 Tax=Novosphingobium sp. G106 TaxID=2849500 RepID=UPI0028123FEA|nr:MarC family protein [Novosphingobium sp. G106]